MTRLLCWFGFHSWIAYLAKGRTTPEGRRYQTDVYLCRWCRKRREEEKEVYQ